MQYNPSLYLYTHYTQWADGGYQRICGSSKIRIPTRWRSWRWQETSCAESESEARGVAGYLQRPHCRGKLLSFSLCSSVVWILFSISLLSLRLYILVFGEIVWWEYELDDYVCQCVIHVLRFLILVWCVLWNWSAVNDLGGWWGRRVARDCSCPLEWLQSCRFRHAFFLVYCGNGHCTCIQGKYGEFWLLI